MTNQAPTLPAEPKHFRIKERIRALCSAVIQGSANPQDRQKFSMLLDLLEPTPDNWRVPQGRADGRADHPTRTAVIYSKLLRAITMLWNGAVPKDIDTHITFAEKVSVLSGNTGYRLVGDPGCGWELELL